MKQTLIDNLKNIPGWRSPDRLVVIAVDDYGNVRLDSRAARENLVRSGLQLSSRFDRFDALETRDDLEALLEVLSGVTDGAGHPAVLTAYSLCANPDFDAIEKDGDTYLYEALPDTFDRLANSQPDAYDGAWSLWREGIAAGLMKPQFHGREHLNVELFERKVRAGDPELASNLAYRSITGLRGETSMPGVGFTHAFGVCEREDIARHRDIIASGLDIFESVFGFHSATFTPPAHRIHPDLYPFAESARVTGIDKPRSCLRVLDRGVRRREVNTLGRRRAQNHVTIVRNVVFEPTSDRSFDSVAHALTQVKRAFRWHKPAIISSHRVNFSGHIDAENRRYGLDALGRLLHGITACWPDVRFITADQLVDRVNSSNL